MDIKTVRDLGTQLIGKEITVAGARPVPFCHFAKSFTLIVLGAHSIASSFVIWDERGDA